jgi:hypothetical protein
VLLRVTPRRFVPGSTCLFVLEGGARRSGCVLGCTVGLIIDDEHALVWCTTQLEQRDGCAGFVQVTTSFRVNGRLLERYLDTVEVRSSSPLVPTILLVLPDLIMSKPDTSDFRLTAGPTILDRASLGIPAAEVGSSA